MAVTSLYPWYSCRDEGGVPASPDRCFDTLTALATYRRWWTLVTVVSPFTEVVDVGARFRLSGRRPGGRELGWDVEVLEVQRPARIELAYVGGSLVGRTAWEISPDGDGARVAYVYRRVRANQPESAASFERFGLRLHSAAIHLDALAGLARYHGGPGAELDDDAWRRRVRAEVARAVS